MGGLKDYFEELKKQQLDEEKKIEIYEKVLARQYSQNFLYKAKFYIKVAAYTFIILVVILSFFPFLFYKAEPTLQIKTISYITGGIYTEKAVKTTDTDLGNQVYADWIGKIVKVKGEVNILRKGQLIKTDKILDGDYLIIDKNTSLEFQIGSGYIGKILGPAKIQVFKTKDGYLLNLIYGKYLEVKKEQQIDQPLKVITDDLEIQPSQVSKKVSFKVIEKGNKKVVENVGDSKIIVKKTDSENKVEKEVILKKDQAAQVDGDIKLLITQIKKGQITKTYSLKEDKVGSGKEADNVNIEELLSMEYKIVPSYEQYSVLKEKLYSSFLEKDILNLINSYLNNLNTDIALNNLLYRVLAIYKAFDLQIDSEVLKAKIKTKSFDIDDLFLLIDQLIAKLTKKYYIEPVYINRLKKIEAWILLLKKNKINPDKYNSFEEVFEKNPALKKFRIQLEF